MTSSEAKKRYKLSEKGRLSKQRWIHSEKRKLNEIRYRQNPIARHKAVLRSTRYLQTHPEARIHKRERDRLYGRSATGRVNNVKATRKYRKTEKGKITRRNTKARRRALLTDAGKFTLAEWQSRCTDYNNRCAICGMDKPLEPDHILPLTKGGTNTIDNIQPACRDCNGIKNNRILLAPGAIPCLAK